MSKILSNTLKTKIRQRETTFGSWITLGHLAIAEIMCRSGFDWLAIDMEHSVITEEDAQSLIQVISLSGVTPLVRVGVNDPTVIKRVMDAGAHGVIVPMVNSKADAEKAVSSVKYPPVGTRGVGLARAQGYGTSFDEYKSWVNENSVVIVQVEHIDAVRSLSEILDVDGVDGFIVGPYDLSASMGKPGEFEDADVLEALAEVKAIAKEKNAMAGFHVIPPDAKEIKKKVAEGYRFIGCSLDTLYLAGNIEQVMSKVRDGSGE